MVNGYERSTSRHERRNRTSPPEKLAGRERKRATLPGACRFRERHKEESSSPASGGRGGQGEEGRGAQRGGGRGRGGRGGGRSGGGGGGGGGGRRKGRGEKRDHQA